VALAGLAAFALRAASEPVAKLFVPVAFAVGAGVFLGLYEAWIGSMVSGPLLPRSVDTDHQLRRRVRRTYGLEVALVVGLIAAAHALLGTDWERDVVWASGISLSASALGVVGGAVALTSEFAPGRYDVVDRPDRNTG
jgi:hypothetical protein